MYVWNFGQVLVRHLTPTFKVTVIVTTEWNYTRFDATFSAAKLNLNRTKCPVSKHGIQNIQL